MGPDSSPLFQALQRTGPSVGLLICEMEMILSYF